MEPSVKSNRPWRLLALGFSGLFVHLLWFGNPATAWLALVAYAPLLIWLRDYSNRPVLNGYVFGLFYGGMNLFWLSQFVARWTLSPALGGFILFTVASIWGLFYGVACLAGKILQRKGHFELIGLAFLFVEVIRCHVPQLEFPFTPLGEPLIAYPWFGALPVTPLVAISLCLATNLLISHLLSGDAKEKSQQFVLAGLFVIPVSLSFIHSRQLTPAVDKVGIKIGLGQLGFDLAYGDPAMEFFKVQEAVNDLSLRARKEQVDLMILPEGIADFVDQPILPFNLSKDLSVLFGASHGSSPRYQAAYLWNGETFQYTNKTHLVLFGEYVPFRNIIPYPADFKLPSGDLVPGNDPHVLKINGKSVGALICFESTFSDVAHIYQQQQADFLAIMSLDDWYVGTSAIPRLQIAARWRAAESGKWIVRVGSLGKTMVINPRGEVMAELPIGDRGLLTYEL